MVAQTSGIPARISRRRAGHLVAVPKVEVLEFPFQTGDSGMNSPTHAGQLITPAEMLAGLAPVMNVKALEGMGGMDRNKAATLTAALELCRRLLVEPAEAPLQVCSPHDLGPQLVVEMGDLEQECLRVVLLDTKNHVLAMPTVYQGSVNQVSIRVGEVFREAVRVNATSMIVVHNHPSGDTTPSPEDVAVTRTLVEAGTLIDIEVLDHLVVGNRNYVSLKERGLGFAPSR